MISQTYALTYPQLMNQARAAGFRMAELTRLRAAYEIAQKQFDGYYRAQGVPFICHLVRTASIALAEELPPAAVMAGLLHASYILPMFDSGSSRGANARCGKQLRETTGQDVETLIQAYDELPWYTAEALQNHVDQAESLDAAGTLRHVLVLRLANELEDYLDLAMAYRGAYPFEEKIRAQGQQKIALARRLGCSRLAEALEASFAQHLAEPLPAEIRRAHRHAYSTRNRWSPVRLARKLAQAVTKRLGARARSRQSSKRSS